MKLEALLRFEVGLLRAKGGGGPLGREGGFERGRRGDAGQDMDVGGADCA